MINFDSKGNTVLQLNSGPDEDSYKIYLSVNIIDDFGGFTTFNITDPTTVFPNKQLENDLFSQINSNNKSSVIIQQIQSGNIKYSKNLLSIAKILNRIGQNNTDSNVKFVIILKKKKY